MRKSLLLLFCISSFILLSCNSGKTDSPVPAAPEPDQTPVQKIGEVKSKAQSGDLLVRLGDDILSYQIKFLNEKDQSYSHAGIIVEKDGQKLVAHITPDDSTKTTIQYISIDSFLNPYKNLTAALFRYDLQRTEIDSVNTLIEGYYNNNVHFDWLYDLSTDGAMYCSEMISKAITKATGNRISFGLVNVPLKMQPLLVRYFKGKLSAKTIATRKIMTIDNLYRIPQCKPVMEITLKRLPGQ